MHGHGSVCVGFSSQDLIDAAKDKKEHSKVRTFYELENRHER